MMNLSGLAVRDLLSSGPECEPAGFDRAVR
jgi:hypothetical protein